MHYRFQIALLVICISAAAQSVSLDFTTIPTSVTPQSLVTGDFNHDGKPDLAVTASEGLVAILLGNGDGTFRTGQTVPVSAPASRIIKADFNNDGNLDLAVSVGGDGKIFILLGKSDGSFQAPFDSGAQTPAGTFATFPASPTFVAGDINGDGKVDLILGPYASALYPCSCTAEVSVLLGKGDGTFQSPVTSVMENVTYARLAPLDFYGDGKIEVALTNFGNQPVGLLNGGTDGKVSVTWLPSPIVDPLFGFPITVGDAKGNGRDDVILVLPYGNGSGVFTIYAYLDGSSTATKSVVSVSNVDFFSGALNMEVTTADLNGDGKLDLLVSDGAGSMYVLPGKGDGTFVSAGAGVYYTGLFAEGAPALDLYGSMTTADFRGTGKQDVVMVLAGKRVVLLKNASGTPPEVAPSGVVSAATLTPIPLVAGSLATIFGDSFAYSTGTASNGSANRLFGANFAVNGVGAPFLWVSPNQANVQIPWEVAGQSQATLVFTRNGMMAQPLTVRIAPYAPGLFTINSQGTGQAAALISNSLSIPAPGPLAGFPTSRPARPGEYVSFYGTGFGPIIEPVSLITGSETPGRISQYYPDEGYYYFPTTQPATATVGGIPATVQWSGLAPSLVGVYQINVLIPPKAPSGAAIPVVVSIGGVAAPVVEIAVGSS